LQAEGSEKILVGLFCRRLKSAKRRNTGSSSSGAQDTYSFYHTNPSLTGGRAAREALRAPASGRQGTCVKFNFSSLPHIWEAHFDCFVKSKLKTIIKGIEYTTPGLKKQPPILGGWPRDPQPSPSQRPGEALPMSCQGGFLRGRQVQSCTPRVHFARADPALGQQCHSAVPGTKKEAKLTCCDGESHF
jgi:hypothetical protein